MENSATFGGTPSPEFVSQFRTQALRFKGGKELLARLEGLACGLDLLLTFVQLHCGSRVESPTRAAIRAHTSSLKKVEETLATLQRDLTNLARRLDEINRQPPVAWRMAQSVSDRPYFLPAALRLPEAMRSYAAQLATIEASVSKEMHDTSPRWAKMGSLRMLAQFLRTDAGKPDYRAIATVLEIGYLAFGTKQTVDRRDLKKSVKRAEKL